MLPNAFNSYIELWNNHGITHMEIYSLLRFIKIRLETKDLAI